jgi:Holliday junction resolvase
MQSSDIAWQVSRCSTKKNLYVKSHNVRDIIQFLTDAVIRHCLTNSQGKGDNSVCHLCSQQTLLGKSLDVVHKDILYVKSHKVRETIQFVTYTVIRHCLASF